MPDQSFCKIKYNSFPLIYFGATVSWFISTNRNYKLYKPIKSTAITCNVQAYLIFMQQLAKFYSKLDMYCRNEHRIEISRIEFFFVMVIILITRLVNYFIYYISSTQSYHNLRGYLNFWIYGSNMTQYHLFVFIY